MYTEEELLYDDFIQYPDCSNYIKTRKSRNEYNTYNIR